MVEFVDLYPTTQTRPAPIYPWPTAGQSTIPAERPASSRVEYPESDGEPMAETDTHRDQMTDALLHPLKERFRHDPNVYISGNLLLYYQEGNRRACVAPDVFVVFGVPKRARRTYKLWKEAKAPDVVFELTSKSTYRDDLGKKRLLYKELGVQEYFLFDPLREHLHPPLQGFYLLGGYYAPVGPDRFGEDEWEMHSEVLGLTLRTYGRILRLYDPERNHYLLTSPEEAQARRDQARARRAAEARAAKAETRAAEAETRAAEEAEARRAAEAEIIQLRALLAHQSS